MDCFHEINYVQSLSLASLKFDGGYGTSQSLKALNFRDHCYNKTKLSSFKRHLLLFMRPSCTRLPFSNLLKLGDSFLCRLLVISFRIAVVLHHSINSNLLYS